jgi:hypothetical protein
MCEAPDPFQFAFENVGCDTSLADFYQVRSGWLAAAI